MRKVLCLILSLAILASLVACSANTSTQIHKVNPTNTKDSGNVIPISEKNQEIIEQLGAVYGKERIELPGNQAYVYMDVMAGKKIFAYGMDSQNNNVFYLINPEDCSVQMLPIQIEGNIYLLGQSDEATYSILTIGESGENIVNFFEESQLIRQQELVLPEEYTGDIITGITVMPEHFIVELSSEIIALNRNCEFEKSLGCFNANMLCSITPEGNLIVAGETTKDSLSEKAVTQVSLFDASLEPLETYELEMLFDTLCTGTADGTILAIKNGVVYSCDYRNNIITAKIDAVSSGLNSSRIYVASADKYIATQRGIPSLWSPIDKDEITELTLATYNLGYPLELLIDMFNESSSDCKIKVIDYASYEDLSNSDNGLMYFNADIVAGFTPDLYDLTNLNVQSFIGNGLLEDMGSYLEQEKIKSTDFVPSALEMLKKEDKLYYIMPSFTLISAIGSRDILGEDTNLTAEKFFSTAVDSSPEELVGPEMTKEDFLRYTLLFNWRQYYSENTETCNFTYENFGRFLEFASSLPEEIDYSQIESQDIMRAYAGEQKLLIGGINGNLVSFFSYYDAAFGGKGEYVGFPSNSSSGKALLPSSLIGISSTSLNKEYAMDFIAFILSDYCQTNGNLSGLPVIYNALEKRIDYWGSEHEKFQKSLVSVYEGARVELKGTPSAEHIKKIIYSAIASADILAIYDENLFQIVYEECQSFFNNRTTIEQCVNSIQSKVGLYIAEQY